MNERILESAQSSLSPSLLTLSRLHIITTQALKNASKLMKNLITVTLICATLSSSSLFLVHAEAGALRLNNDNHQAVSVSVLTNRGGGRLRVLQETDDDDSNTTCIDHTDFAEPNYRECTTVFDDGSNFKLMRSLNFDESNLACVKLNGDVCRSSYYCDNGNLALDCRNLVPPGETCGAVDCDGNCIDYPATSQPLLFGYSENSCAKLGYYCVGTYGDLVSCYWISILGDGVEVTISTDEGPSSSAGNPGGFGYFGECYAKVDGNSCSSCDISCIETSGNYAQFDCRAFSEDPCAVQDCDGCTGSDGGQITTIPPTTIAPTNSSTDVACVEHEDSLEPNYIECNFTLVDWEMTLLLSSSDSENAPCLTINGKPCRSSYVCEDDTLAWDCRNLFQPGEPCGAKDCYGNCIDYPATSEPLIFDYSNNGCGKLGYNCVGTSGDLASCYWLNFLPDGTQVRVSTDEGPTSSIGNPDGLGYSGECYASVEGTSCNSCSITCIQSGGNYGQFDCSNLITSGDPCAVQTCSGCAGNTDVVDYPTQPSTITPTTPSVPSTNLPTVPPATKPPTLINGTRLVCAVATRAVKDCKSGIFTVCNSGTSFSCADNTVAEQANAECQTILCSNNNSGASENSGWRVRSFFLLLFYCLVLHNAW